MVAERFQLLYEMVFQWRGYPLGFSRGAGFIRLLVHGNVGSARGLLLGRCVHLITLSRRLCDCAERLASKRAERFQGTAACVRESSILSQAWKRWSRWRLM